MNIRDFEYITAIDELKSFSQAARKCNVSAPALSMQVQKIEREISVQIFERNKRQIITTDKGMQFVKHAKAILKIYKEIQNIQSEEDQLKIALIPTICPYLLPLIVDSLKQSLPDVKLFFLELKTVDLLAKLKTGEIDVGILAYFPNLIDETNLYRKLYNEEFLLTLPKKSKYSAKDLDHIIANKELMLLEEGNCMSENIKDICQIYSRDSYSDFYATNIETVKSMVRIGNGAALLPKFACLNEKHLKLLPLKPKKYREIGLVTRRNYGTKAQIKIIADVIKRVAD
jgi:LysR family hydrogen peroxide-inducible transcriptional activator